MPFCAFSFVRTAVTLTKKISTVRTLGMYVRTACERAARVAKRMCLPTCFLLKHEGGALGIVKSPVCNIPYSFMDRSRIDKQASKTVRLSRQISTPAGIDGSYVCGTRRFAPRAAYAARYARSGRKSTSNYAKRTEGR